MPIRINFLTEALAEAEMRRRDPIKRVLFLGMFLVALSLVWYSSKMLEYKLDQQQLGQINEQIQGQTNQYNQVLSDLKLVGENNRRLAALQQLSTNRFLQGDLLDALQKIYTPHVQLLRIRLDQAYTIQAPVPAKTDARGVTTPGRPGSSTEKIILTLDAKDSSIIQGDQVNHYKEAIVNSPYFKSSHVDNADVRLLNLSPAQTTVNGKPFVLFTLECRFPSKTR